MDMNREWSEQNKQMQTLLRKRDTYPAGLDTLFALRGALFDTLLSLREELSPAQLSAMPFPKAAGYHSKTVAYSVWHIFRIEDIVANTLISGDEQVLFAEDWQKRIGAPVMTTGNELAGQQIADFSASLDPDALYAYASAVKARTEAMLRSLPYDRLKDRIPPERRAALLNLHVVSADENAAWLVDYWCGKDIRGLIGMPFSRHWIMHTEAAMRIFRGIVSRGQRPPE